MCRFLAYLGPSIFLDELVCKPQHSLVRQSLRADQAKAVTNGDGYWDDDEEVDLSIRYRINGNFEWTSTR